MHEQAALGASTILLSGLFWMLFFLSVSTQTEVAHGLGAGDLERARKATGLALAISLLGGICVAIVVAFLLGPAAHWMEASGEIEAPFIAYSHWRLPGVPGSLAMGVAFGAFRGYQNVRTPLAISIGVTLLNIALDPLLIWGAGPIPPLGVRGAALASALSQWAGAVASMFLVWRLHGVSWSVDASILRRLITVGRDMLVRTASLTLFLILATQKATEMGAAAGAVHLGVRQTWALTALLLDAFATTAQSFVGYFLAAGRVATARHVARVATFWSFSVGAALTAVMLLATDHAWALLVVDVERDRFASAWIVSALFQPLNGISFATDGIHWGAGDFAFLRNVTVTATCVGLVGLWFVDPESHGLDAVWLVTGAWIATRAFFGFVRLWPGLGKPPMPSARPR